MLERFTELSRLANESGLQLEVFPLRDHEMTEEENELKGYSVYRAELYVNSQSVGVFSDPELLNQAILQHKTN